MRETLGRNVCALSDVDLKTLAEDYERMSIKKSKAGPAENGERRKLRLAYISMRSKARWPCAVSLVLAVVGLALAAGGYVIPEHLPTVHLP